MTYDFPSKFRTKLLIYIYAYFCVLAGSSRNQLGMEYMCQSAFGACQIHQKKHFLLKLCPEFELALMEITKQ